MSHRGVDTKRLKSIVVFTEVSEAISHEKQHGVEEGGVLEVVVLEVDCKDL